MGQNSSQNPSQNPSAPLLSVTTGYGFFTVTEDAITLSQNGGRNVTRMLRANITNIDARKQMGGFLGIGAPMHITIRGLAGEKLSLTRVKPKDADAILALLKQ